MRGERGDFTSGSQAPVPKSSSSGPRWPSREHERNVGCALRTTMAGGTYPPLQYLGGVRLIVFPEDEPRAREILADWREAQTQELDEDEDFGELAEE